MQILTDGDRSDEDERLTQAELDGSTVERLVQSYRRPLERVATACRFSTGCSEFECVHLGPRTELEIKLPR